MTSPRRYQLRTSLEQTLPPWLLRTTGARYLFAMLAPADAVLEWALQGAGARRPSQCDESVLPALGTARGISRGMLESAAAYRRRLLLWRATGRRAALGYGLLAHVAGILSPAPVLLRIVTNSGVMYERSRAGVYSVSTVSWDWDGDAASWSRYWLLVYPGPAVPPATDPVGADRAAWGYWTGGTWGDDESGAWGLDIPRPGDYAYQATRTTSMPSVTTALIDSIRAELARRQPPHAMCHGIMIGLDDTIFPTVAGDYEQWSARDGDFLYCAGTTGLTA
uniref:Uncharacterized protein n=1 Tax=viral metagenome TaxID=1070528 RepID=A0A6M3IL98_9ZZZZ